MDTQDAYYSDNLEEYSKAIASNDGFYSHRVPPGSDKSAFTRYGYEYSRPDEALPRSHKEIVVACDGAYKRSGLVRNMIDLMGDFVVQGMEIVHTSVRQEQFYRHWWARINGLERSERIANSLFRLGAAPISRRLAKIGKRDRKKIQESVAIDGSDLTKVSHTLGQKNIIPWEYTILNPASLKVIGGCAATLSKDVRYAVDIPKIYGTNLQSQEEKKIFDQTIRSLKKDIREAMENGRSIPLDPVNTTVLHYKKDDWQQWAYPIIYSVLQNILIIEKMHLADQSALDSAIDSVRIIKIGSLEHSIMPGQPAFQKLADVMATNTGAGRKDIIWGPDIDMLESKNINVDILGNEKYVHHLNSIYAGLGIPPTLTGTDKASGTTNNLVSLKTLVKRLEYTRSVLVKFWEGEFEIVRQAMGWSKAPTIQFTDTNLGDEEAEKKLWIDLSERGIISDEAIRERFNINPRIEESRVRKEESQREKGSKPPKAGPYYDPQLDEKAEIKEGSNPDQETKTGQPGRPKNSKDTVPRKSRKVNPVVKARMRIWAEKAQEEIFDRTKGGILEWFSKKNMRSLTVAESQEAENIRLSTLLNLEPFVEITDEVLGEALASQQPTDKINQYLSLVKSVQAESDKPLTSTELRKLQVEIYIDG